MLSTDFIKGCADTHTNTNTHTRWSITTCRVVIDFPPVAAKKLVSVVIILQNKSKKEPNYIYFSFPKKKTPRGANKVKDCWNKTNA